MQLVAIFHDWKNDRSSGPSASADALLVVAATGENCLNLERELVDAVEDAADPVGRLLVARDGRCREWALGIEDKRVQ
ncbi:hypothetical protein [Natrinema ejinorense]|uniref:hypothetical protein n=1 Tax=Natrinema ejinorense TaxID=373386 RepID=UPI00118104FD|nr:hypothetical protein [Natrinema ejinorense]